MGTSQSTPTGETQNGPEQVFVQDLFYYPPLNAPTSQTPNRPVHDYLQDPFSYPPMSTPTDQTPNGPVQGYLQDHFYYPPLSTPTDQLVQGNLQDPLNYQTPHGPVQGYLQDPFYYPPLSTPTDQPPNRPVQGYLQDPGNYPLMSTLTDQILNGPDQDFAQDLFYYPPLNTVPMPPNQPVQDYLQDPFNYPPLSTVPTSQTPNEPVQGDLEDPFYPPLVQTLDRKRMCCSCHGFEHVQPTKVEYINLGDGRYLCPKCLSVSLTEPKQLEPVIHQVHSFFDDYLKLPVKKDIPIFFVDGNEMNRHDANDGTEMVYGQIHYAKATIKTVKRCIRRGAALEVATETKKVKGDKVAAILLLFGLPKHVVGAALVHEMVHAWIRLQGLRLQDWFFKWKNGVEEGLCQAASYEWLKYTAGDYDPSYTEKEAKIVELLTTYFKSNMKECCFSRYPAEFRTAKCAFKKYGVKPTLKHFVRTRKILE